MNALIAVFAAALAAEVRAQPAPGCAQLGPEYVACPKAASGCRMPLGDEWLKTKESGLEIDVGFLKVLGVKVKDIALQPVHESVQLMREKLSALVHDHDSCAIGDAEYRTRHDAIMGFRDALAGEVRRIDDIARDLESISKRDVDTARKIADLEAGEQQLKRKVSSLSTSLSGSLARVKKQLQRREETDARLDLKLTSFQEEVEGKFRENEGKMTSWQVAVDAALDQRVADLRAEILREMKDLRLLVLSMSQERATASHAVINVSGNTAWLGGEPRPGVAVSWETLRATGGLLSGLSVFYEASGLLWRREGSFNVFPGQQPAPFEQDASFLAGQAGAKRYLALGQSTDLYLGAAGGLLTQPKDGWRVGALAQALAGVALYFGRSRAGVELRYGFSVYHAKYVEFDPLGDARSGYRARFLGLASANAVFSPFSW